jgi:hypothetical protein
MAFDKAAFRGAFPEFTSTVDYPDAMLTFQLLVAGAYVSEDKWSELYTVGMSLCLAHHLVLAKGNQSGTPGSGTGLVSGQSVGDISASFDTSSTSEERGGQWNLTTYGQQFTRMARLVGGCAIQIN